MSRGEWLLTLIFLGAWILLEFWRRYGERQMRHWYEQGCPKTENEWLLFLCYQWYERHWYNLQTLERLLIQAFRWIAIIAMLWLLLDQRFRF